MSGVRGLVRQPPLLKETIAMEPMNLRAIARDAALRADTKTLFHTLALLERLLPIAAFMDFRNSARRGRVSTTKSAGAVPPQSAP